jgi:hypothetical protein
MKAYAVEGKGADLGGYIHEWGGSVSALLEIFAFARQSRSKISPATLTVITPQHSTNLRTQLCALGARENQGYLGMIKILNTERLFAKIKRYALQIGIQNLILETHLDGWRIGIGDSSHGGNTAAPQIDAKVEVTSKTRPDAIAETKAWPSSLIDIKTEHELTRYIFGPSPKASSSANLNPIAAKLEKIFPLPMWIWGWDSV